MADEFEPVESAVSPAAEAFYAGALDRIRRFMAVLGVVATLAVWAVKGWPTGVGVLLGCIIAWINFYWLKQVIAGLADGATASGRKPSSRGIVARFLLRYALIGIGAYAIFRVSKDSLYGLLGGLFLTVAAILAEAMYEAYVALRRGL